MWFDSGELFVSAVDCRFSVGCVGTSIGGVIDSVGGVVYSVVVTDSVGGVVDSVDVTDSVGGVDTSIGVIDDSVLGGIVLSSVGSSSACWIDGVSLSYCTVWSVESSAEESISSRIYSLRLQCL